MRYSEYLSRPQGRILFLVIFGLILALLTQSASAVIITRSFTGHWDQPDQESQGIIFQVVKQRDGSKDGVVYWFTYNLEGEPMWLLGVGDVENNALHVDLLQVRGPTFMQESAPETRNLQTVGTLDLTFSDCASGDAVFQPNEVIGTGGLEMTLSRSGALQASEFAIRKLTNIFNTTCSGGISDDTPAQARSSEVAQFVANTGLHPDASVKIKLEERPDRTKFSVEIEDVPVGDYDLFVDGVLVAIITVVDDGAGGTEGEVEFRSPIDDEELLLDFDPRDKLIEISQGDQVFFSGIFDGTSTTDDDDEDNCPADNPDCIDDDDDDACPADNPDCIPDDDDDTCPADNPDCIPDDDDDDCPVDNPGCDDDDDIPQDPASVGAPGFGDATAKFQLTNSGVDPEMEGDAELEQKSDEVEFEVEIEHALPGLYELWVGGELRATITVVDLGSDTEGEVEFSFPQDDDTLLLDFDPRGQLIEVVLDGVVMLSGMFP